MSATSMQSFLGLPNTHIDVKLIQFHFIDIDKAKCNFLVLSS